MYVITTANYKGGSGKTTTALQLAASLTARGHRVGLVDLDPVAAATQLIGERPVPMPHLIWSMVPEEPGQPSPELMEGFIDTTWGVKLLPSGKKLATGLRMVLDDHPEGDLALRNIVRTVEGEFDFLILDCPGQFFEVVPQALLASDEVVITVEVGSAIAVQQMAEVARDFRRYGTVHTVGRFGILPCRADIRLVQTRAIVATIDEMFPDNIYRTEDEEPLVIRQTTRVTEAASMRVPVREYEPGCTAASDYDDFAQLIDRRAHEVRTQTDTEAHAQEVA